MVVALLACLAGTVGTGLIAYGEQGKGPLAGIMTAIPSSSAAESLSKKQGREESLVSELHSSLANLTLALVVFHVLGVALASYVHLVFTNVGLIFANRSFSASLIAALRRPNAALWRVLAVILALMSIVLLWLPARNLFHFGPLHLDDVVICLGAGLLTLIALDLFKPLWRARFIN